jgi:hypothetical protein
MCFKFLVANYLKMTNPGSHWTLAKQNATKLKFVEDILCLKMFILHKYGKTFYVYPVLRQCHVSYLKVYSFAGILHMAPACENRELIMCWFLTRYDKRADQN